MSKVLKNNRGVALILTLTIVALIVTLTLHFNAAMRSEIRGASNFRDGLRLACVAKSGFNFGLAILMEDAAENSFDSTGGMRALSKDLSSSSPSYFDGSRFEIEITDLSGRIQINRLITENGNYDPGQKAILIRLLGLVDPDIQSERAEDIADAIKDWMDRDNEITRFGAEESYYQELDPPYSCRNGPLEYLEELLLIKGITPSLFYGIDGNPGISRYLTVNNDDTGRININTAEPLVLQSLSGDMDSDLVDEIIEYRNDNNDLSDPNWYKEALSTSEDIFDPNLITTKSSLFEIRSMGIQDVMVKEIRAVVERDNGNLVILSWKTL